MTLNINEQTDARTRCGPQVVATRIGLLTKFPLVLAAITVAAIMPQAVNSAPVSSAAEPLVELQKIKTPVSRELDTQETGFHLGSHPLGASYHHAGHHPSSNYYSTDADRGHDSAKNAYAKQASDWSLYDQGNHGHHDKFGDKLWADKGHGHQANHGKHDSYGNSYNAHGSNHGSGYYSRDRGYGYEKHYSYDKELASKNHADSHSSQGSSQGLHDQYGNSKAHAHSRYGHDRAGQLSRYGNHGYAKKASNLAAHHDLGHNHGHDNYHHQVAAYPSSYSASYASSEPIFKTSHFDYGPQMIYPSSYPSYY